jgi:hypothetical protein
MSDPGTAKSKPSNVDAKAEQQEQDLLKVEEEIDAEMEQREENRVTDEQSVQQDLNQGMDTGTHSSVHRGVNWAPEFSVRETPEKDDPKKTPNKE